MVRRKKGFCVVLGSLWKCFLFFLELGLGCRNGWTSGNGAYAIWLSVLFGFRFWPISPINARQSTINMHHSIIRITNWWNGKSFNKRVVQQKWQTAHIRCVHRYWSGIVRGDFHFFFRFYLVIFQISPIHQARVLLALSPYITWTVHQPAGRNIKLLDLGASNEPSLGTADVISNK